MLIDRMDQHLGTRVLFILACLVVVIAGLQAAAPILLPFFVALFMAVLSLPIMAWLQRYGVRAPLAILVAVLAEVGVFVVLVLIASRSTAELMDRLPFYLARLRGLLSTADVWLENRGMPEGWLNIAMLDPDLILSTAAAAVGQVASLVTSTLLVLLILVFIMGEASVFPRKFRHIFGSASVRGGGRVEKMVTEVQEYLWIKTLVSLATGLLVGLFTWWMGLDSPVLLGLLAFLLNYVPTIGSIIASVPAVALALVLHGPAEAVFVALFYLALNTLFGNIIEPTLLGRRLGLSPLIVILSLLFWGWTWGPVGALLAVPLTMVVKIMMENTQDLRWVGILLDKGIPAHDPEASTASSTSSS